MCVDIVRRLKLYMEHVGLPSTQFADIAKIARPTISQLLNGRNRKVSNELIEKIHAAYPDLNIMWLMFGDGEMQLGDAESSDKVIQPTLFNDYAPMPESPPASPQANTAGMQSFKLKKQTAHSQDPKTTDSKEPSIQIPVNSANGRHKKIQTIMVCYTDNSYEMFLPAQQ